MESLARSVRHRVRRVTRDIPVAAFTVLVLLASLARPAASQRNQDCPDSEKRPPRCDCSKGPRADAAGPAKALEPSHGSWRHAWPGCRG